MALTPVHLFTLLGFVGDTIQEQLARAIDLSPERVGAIDTNHPSKISKLLNVIFDT